MARWLTLWGIVLVVLASLYVGLADPSSTDGGAVEGLIVMPPGEANPAPEPEPAADEDILGDTEMREGNAHAMPRSSGAAGSFNRLHCDQIRALRDDLAAWWHWSLMNCLPD